MTKPLRLTLSRANGFDLQAASKAINGLEAVNVARGPGRIFGNPFVVGRNGTRAECVDFFAHMLNGHYPVGATPDVDTQQIARAAIIGNIRRLTGRNLACWCRQDGKPCHADILLDLANDPKKLIVCDEIAGRKPAP